MTTTKRSKSNEVALLATTNVPDILEKLDEEIRKLKHIEETPWKIGATVRVDGFPTGIQDEKLVPNLIRLLSKVLAAKEYYDKAADTLGLGTYKVFDISGASVEDFVADINLRIAIIEQKEKLEKLKSFKERISKFLSEDDQKAALLKEMSKFLNNE